MVVRAGQRSRKKAVNCPAQTSSRTPWITSGRWLSLRSRTTSQSEPAAPLLVARAVDHPGDTGLDERARAHGARLQGDHQGAAGQPPRAEHGGGSAQGQHFGVCRRVAGRLTLVVTGGEQGAVRAEDDGADRHIMRPTPPARPRPGHGAWVPSTDPVRDRAEAVRRDRVVARSPADPNGRPPGPRPPPARPRSPPARRCAGSAVPSRTARGRRAPRVPRVAHAARRRGRGPGRRP